MAVRMTNVVAFRHNLDYPGGFGCSDMYFCANCVPVDEHQTEVCFDADEIADCRCVTGPHMNRNRRIKPEPKLRHELTLHSRQALLEPLLGFVSIPPALSSPRYTLTCLLPTTGA